MSNAKKNDPIEINEKRMQSNNSEDIPLLKEGGQEDFKPKIIGFLCNWCSYAGADLAGVSRLQMPPSLRIIRVMCSGSLEPYVILEPLKKGVDGVLVMGCHPGDCHYISGNLQAKNKYNMMKNILGLTDFGNERLRLEWVSASEGKQFQNVIVEFTNDLKKLGPNPIRIKGKESQHFIKDIAIAQKALDGFRLRSIVGKEFKLVNEGNVYNERCSQERFEEIIGNIEKEELINTKILDVIAEEPKSVVQISEIINEPTDVVFEYIGYLWKRQMVQMMGHSDIHPIYQKARGVQ
jgi:F420-non-reducing hydrogenase iron-sulfur subunit